MPASWSCGPHIQLRCLAVSTILIMGFLTTTGAETTPTINLPPFTSFEQHIIKKRCVRQLKTYSGQRLRNDSVLMIYHHESTVAVAEYGPEKLLLGCELIGIRTDQDRKNLLQNLSKYNRPEEIKFEEMIKLMDQCENADKQEYNATEKAFKNPLTMLIGIVPGTKWCGPGDIATTYNDLGTKIAMDRCCRQHDLCPVKIRAYQRKYGLSNYSLYTKSHCTCDDMLFSCLKRTNTAASQLMGSVYFNIVKVPCLAGENNHYQFRAAKTGF